MPRDGRAQARRERRRHTIPSQAGLASSIKNSLNEEDIPLFTSPIGSA